MNEVTRSQAEIFRKIILARDMVACIDSATAELEALPPHARHLVVSDLGQLAARLTDMAHGVGVMKTDNASASHDLVNEIERLRAALSCIANCGQSAEPDHWEFRKMARRVARRALDGKEPT